MTVQPTKYPAAEAITAACKKTLTSAAFMKFMYHAVQSELAEAQPQGPTLPTITGMSVKTRYSSTSDGMHISSDCGLIKINLYRDRSSEHMTPKGLWWGRESRIDSNGVEWDRSFPLMVQDDFGTLVEVPT
jgi:hypothetical protein